MYGFAVVVPSRVGDLGEGGGVSGEAVGAGLGARVGVGLGSREGRSWGAASAASGYVVSGTRVRGLAKGDALRHISDQVPAGLSAAMAQAGGARVQASAACLSRAWLRRCWECKWVLRRIRVRPSPQCIGR